MPMQWLFSSIPKLLQYTSSRKKIGRKEINLKDKTFSKLPENLNINALSIRKTHSRDR